MLVASVAVLMPLMASALERTTPEMQGVPSRAVEALFDSLTSMPDVDIHSVMVLRHGKVIGEIYPQPFAPQYRHTVYSVSKTFTAAAVGIAISENRLRLTDRVAAFFPELLPDSISLRLAQITVDDLLTMRSGIIPDRELRNHATEWRRAFLAKPIKGEPGSSFNYDSLNSYMLSAIVQRVTGMTSFDYLNSHVFVPMGITDIAWELSPEGISTGGWGVYASSESLAMFGQLLLQLERPATDSSGVGRPDDDAPRARARLWLPYVAMRGRHRMACRRRFRTIYYGVPRPGYGGCSNRMRQWRPSP